jgi:hypothetical protein
MIAFAVARRWPNVLSNSLAPGWVATKMGGAGAPDDLDQAHLTQVWLAAGEDRKADVTRQYFFHLKPKEPNPQSRHCAAGSSHFDVHGNLRRALPCMSGVNFAIKALTGHCPPIVGCLCC